MTRQIRAAAALAHRFPADTHSLSRLLISCMRFSLACEMFCLDNWLNLAEHYFPSLADSGCCGLLAAADLVWEVCRPSVCRSPLIWSLAFPLSFLSPSSLSLSLLVSCMRVEAVAQCRCLLCEADDSSLFMQQTRQATSYAAFAKFNQQLFAAAFAYIQYTRCMNN